MDPLVSPHGVGDSYDGVRCLAGQLSNLAAQLDANTWHLSVLGCHGGMGSLAPPTDLGLFLTCTCSGLCIPLPVTQGNEFQFLFLFSWFVCLSVSLCRGYEAA